MNRFVRMILFNLPRFISAYCKLCRYARHPERYSYQEKWDHIHGLFSMCMGSSNVDLTVTGLENIPREESFVLYGNHQGLFDIMAVAATCPVPLGAVYKQEMKNVPFMKQLFACNFISTICKHLIYIHIRLCATACLIYNKWKVSLKRAT